MSLTFDNLPIEIRHCVYSYVLLDQNVAYPKRCIGRSFRSKFEVALFRVSKFISADSLQFFHSQNAFVIIKSDSIKLLESCKLVAPAFVGAETAALESFVLEIHLSQGRSLLEPRLGASEPRLDGQAIDNSMTSTGFPWCSVIIAARHLPKFILLMNTWVSNIDDTSPTIRTVLSINFRTFRSSHRVTDLLIDGLSGIRTGKIIDWEPKGRKERSKKILDNSTPGLLDVELLGDLSQDNREKFTATAISTNETLSDNISQVLAVRAKGDHFYTRGDLAEARDQYTVAHLLSRPLLACDRNTGLINKQLLVKIADINVRNRLGIAKVDSQLGFVGAACYMLEQADSLVSFLQDPNLSADLHLEWGSILAESGLYKDALEHLEKAKHDAPSSTILAKIKEVTALHARPGA